MQTRSNVFLWVLYDFANSLVSIVFFLYFAQWIVVEQGVSDFSFNITFTVSALLLLCTAPLSGVLLDTYWRRIAGLRFTTIGTAVFYGACGVAAIQGNAKAALILFTLGLYSYLLSFTFYTPLLQDIVPPAKRGRASGLGIGANYAGQFTGLLIALPFSEGSLAFFGASPRAETLLPSVIAFFLLSLPTLLFFQEPHKDRKGATLRSALRTTYGETKALFRSAGVVAFLASYFLFNDAILTASNNFPIFLEQVWNVSDSIKTLLLLAVLVMCGIGGTLAGIVADRFGHKRTLLWIVVGWVFLLPMIGLLRNFQLFVCATVMMGIWFGASWTVSRSVMAHVSPPGKHNLAFAYFGLAERASSFIGPVVWGLVLANLTHLGSDRYRIATLAITSFIVLGAFALKRVPDDRGP